MQLAQDITTKELVWLKDDVASFPSFMDVEQCQQIIEFFEDQGTTEGHWMQTCFYDSLGMALVSSDEALQRSGLEDRHQNYFEWLRLEIKAAIEQAFGREVVTNSTHAQKWPVGAFARWHSDNSDLEGNPSAWSDNKFASILYLNDDYEGGELIFRDFDLEVKLPQGSLIVFPGGIENIHRVEEIREGNRITVVGFWDYADSVYSDEEIAAREAEIAFERILQTEQKALWSLGNSNA
jgi:hypothetical protein